MIRPGDHRSPQPQLQPSTVASVRNKLVRGRPLTATDHQVIARSPELADIVRLISSRQRQLF